MKIQLIIPAKMRKTLSDEFKFGNLEEALLDCWTNQGKSLPEDVRGLCEVLTRSFVPGAQDWVMGRIQAFPVNEGLDLLARTAVERIYDYWQPQLLAA